MFLRNLGEPMRAQIMLFFNGLIMGVLVMSVLGLWVLMHQEIQFIRTSRQLEQAAVSCLISK